MLFKRISNLFLLLFLVFTCPLPFQAKGRGAYDEISSDDILKSILKRKFNPITMNKKKHGIFHQYDFALLSFGAPLVYRMVSFENIVSFIEELVNLVNHDKHLRFFFSKKNDEYGSIQDSKPKYKFLNKYKNLTYSSSDSSCVSVLYSQFIQIKKSNFFASYGLIYEYSKHVYSFNYYLFNKDKDIFQMMKCFYNGDTVLNTIEYVEKIFQGLYPRITYNKTSNNNNVKPNTNIQYENILENFKKEYIKDKRKRKEITNFSQLYDNLNDNNKAIFLEDLKEKYLDYNSRNFWDEKSKNVSFSVSDMGFYFGIAYVQNKIDPFFGWFLSCSFAFGIQYIMCINGLNYKVSEYEDKFYYDNNWYAFLKANKFYKNSFSFFTKIRIEAGYGPVRFFIAFKSFDMYKVLKNMEEVDRSFVINKEEGNLMVFKLDEYNEACYNLSTNYIARFNEGKDGGFKRLVPRIIQFGISLNL